MSKSRIVAGVAIFVAVIFSWLWVFTLFNRFYLQFNRAQYQVESFLVTDAVYPSSRRGFRSLWLAGTVTGRSERVCPVLPPGVEPGNAEEILTIYPRASSISVLYNPAAPEILIQGETLRVLHFTPDFWSKENRLCVKLLCFVLLPVPITVGIYRYVSRRTASS